MLATVDEIGESADPGEIKLRITMAFKDAQISLLEEAKRLSGFEFCSQLKSSFSTVSKAAANLQTFGMRDLQESRLSKQSLSMSTLSR